MSWNIKTFGTREAVRAKILADKYLPTLVKSLIITTIHDLHPSHANNPQNGIRVEGYGHHNDVDGSCLGNIGKLEVEPIELHGVPVLLPPVSEAARQMPQQSADNIAQAQPPAQ
jgi:hypothetical protein